MSNLGEQLRSGVKGIQGISDAIRGTAMNETDKAFGTQDSTKNENIANKGLANMERADNNIGHNHGVNSNTTTTSGTASANTVPATSSGAHSVAPGNIGSTGSTVGYGSAGVQEQPGLNQRF